MFDLALLAIPHPPARVLAARLHQLLLAAIADPMRAILPHSLQSLPNNARKMSVKRMMQVIIGMVAFSR